MSKIKLFYPDTPRYRLNGYQNPKNVVWESSQQSYVFENKIIKLEIDTKTVNTSTKIRLQAVFKSETKLDFLSIPLKFECIGSPFFLDRYFEWKPLKKKEATTSHIPLIVQWKSGASKRYELKATHNTAAVIFQFKSEYFLLEAILDAAALHPRWDFQQGIECSKASNRYMEGQSIDMELLVHQLPEDNQKTNTKPVFLSPYPEGTECGFVITDHSDFDCVDRLKLFLDGNNGNNGWFGKQLKMTKGVFAIDPPPNIEKKASSLADFKYAQLIKKLSEDGSEIVPHALCGSGNLDPKLFHSTLESFSNTWKPKVWIDHGKTIDYCYSMGGADSEDYMLRDALIELNYKGLWAYHDTMVDPFHSLNLFSEKNFSFCAFLRLSQNMFKALFRGKFGRALHLLRCSYVRFFHGKFSQFVLTVLRRIIKRKGKIMSRRFLEWLRTYARAILKLKSPFYSKSEIILLSPVIYPERGSIYHTESRSLSLFTSMELTHPDIMYNAKNILKLIQSKGFHIGHTYLLSHISYLSSIFEGEPNQLRLTQNWIQFVQALSTEVCEGRVWNPTMGELLTYQDLAKGIRIERLGATEIKISNHNDDKALGITVLVGELLNGKRVLWGGSLTANIKPWGSWTAIWGDIEARQHVKLSWDSG